MNRRSFLRSTAIATACLVAGLRPEFGLTQQERVQAFFDFVFQKHQREIGDQAYNAMVNRALYGSGVAKTRWCAEHHNRNVLGNLYEEYAARTGA